MGIVNYVEEIEERQNDDAFLSQKPSTLKSLATVSELRKHIKHLNAEIAALNNGDEISRLRNWGKGLQEENERLEINIAKLEKRIQNLNKDIQDLRRQLNGEGAKKNVQNNTESGCKKIPKSRAKPSLSNHLSKLNYKKNGDPKPKRQKRK